VLAHAENLAPLANKATVTQQTARRLSPAVVLRQIGCMSGTVVCSLELADLAATEALAATVAAAARSGDAILLEGPLGAGKSAFARAFLRAAASDPALEVPSPTFTLVQSYATPRFRVHHFDLWRLDGPDAVAELGWDDALTDLVIVEWPDRLGPLRPALALTLSFMLLSADARRVVVSGWPDRIGALS
jgi:tRNA threonylcarbamoyladenosine biosynthesis protein TsaE